MLKTDYKNDELNVEANTRRKYNMITNPDGTVSFEDVTSYNVVGDTFGAQDINETNEAINEASKALEEVDSKYAPISHNQAASTITAGTFAGVVKVPASTAYTTAQVRNIVVVASDVGAGASVSYPNGTIVLCKG